jgi:hypothetical protein
MKTRLFLLLPAVLATLSVSTLFAQTLSPEVQSKIDAQRNQINVWASDPLVVVAVRAHNATLPADHAALTQDKWRSLTVLDPLVRSFSKNAAGQFLKSKKSDVIVEAFVSDAAGLKVAFLAKTSSWSHAGKPKHDVPMTGKAWQGAIEVDESTGQQQVQIGVPVLDGGKPIGSLVVGLSVTKLAE